MNETGNFASELLKALVLKREGLNEAERAEVTERMLETLEKIETRERVSEPETETDEKDDVTVLEAFTSRIQRELRPVEEDGIVPPTLYDGPRRRTDGKFMVSDPSALGMRRIGLMIHAVRLVQYQRKYERRLAIQAVERETGFRYSTLKKAYTAYATREEAADNPYPLPELTYGLVQEKLVVNGLALADAMPDHARVKTAQVYRYRCLREQGHKGGEAELSALLKWRGCRECFKSMKRRKRL